MSQTFVTTGNFADSRVPGCHTCGWEGATTDSVRAHRAADRHECDPADVEAHRAWKATERAGNQVVARGGDGKDSRGMEQKAAVGLEFTGMLKNVQMVAPKQKDDYRGQRLEGGSLVLTLEVPRPALPSTPTPKYPLNRYVGFGGHSPVPEPKGERPTDPDELEKKDGEAEDAFEKRWNKAQKAYDKWESENRPYDEYRVAAEDYQHEMELYERAMQGEGPKFAAWMHLAGVGAVLQGMPVSINLSPDSTALEKYLPGFSPAMALAAPDESAEAAG